MALRRAGDSTKNALRSKFASTPQWQGMLKGALVFRALQDTGVANAACALRMQGILAGIELCSEAVAHHTPLPRRENIHVQVRACTILYLGVRGESAPGGRIQSLVPK